MVRSLSRAAVVVAVTIAAACSAENPSTAPTTTASAPTTQQTTSDGTTPQRTSAGGDAAAGTATPVTVPSTATAPIDCVGALTGPDTRAYRDDVGEVDVDLVSVDVYRRPGASGCPVIVWVHGGGWRTGDKAGKAIGTKVAFAGELGAALVSLNYRLVTPGGEVRWPVMGEDVAAGVGWVVEHAESLGIDPEQVVLMGHSAGGHLVSIVATDPGLLAAAGVSRDDVRCVVSLDSAAYDITLSQVRSRPLFAAAFGDDPVTLAGASPTVQAREHPAGLPDALVVTRGSQARVAEADEFAAAIRAGGAVGQLVEARGDTHEQVNTELGVAGEDVVTPPVRDFLRACFE